MLAIIDYGVGNLRSVQKAFEKVGADARIVHTPEEIASADKVVLPGVGAIKPAMDKLNQLNLIEAINNAVKNGKPFLGICVGYQLLFEKSDEGGAVSALGILKGEVKKFPSLKVPQMGWNQLHLTEQAGPLFTNIADQSNVYFCHSYYVAAKDAAIVSAKTDYGITYASAVQSGNVFGVQFHPEKSQNIGLQILKNFTEFKA